MVTSIQAIVAMFKSEEVPEQNGGADPPALSTQPDQRVLSLLSVVIPAKDEEGCIVSTVEHLFVELRLKDVPHEIVVVDDGSVDNTWQLLEEARDRIPTLVPIQNLGPHGFGRAVVCGLDQIKGDAVVIMMADESDDCRDVVTYWKVLNEGYDCVFGSRFIKGGGTIDYPYLKLKINRLANLFLRILFRINLNDTTNAFKAYRHTVIDGCRPFLSPHFNLTIEIPLKAIVRGPSLHCWAISARGFIASIWRTLPCSVPSARARYCAAVPRTTCSTTTAPDSTN